MSESLHLGGIPRGAIRKVGSHLIKGLFLSISRLWLPGREDTSVLSIHCEASSTLKQKCSCELTTKSQHSTIDRPWIRHNVHIPKVHGKDDNDANPSSISQIPRMDITSMRRSKQQSHDERRTCLEGNTKLYRCQC